jgi:hypothetical protein
MDQPEPTPRRRRTGLLAGALVAGVLGVFAVGAVASGGGGEASTQQQAPTPSFVQDEAQPEPNRDGRDCPRGGDRQAPQGDSTQL